MKMVVVDKPVMVSFVEGLAKAQFGSLVKATVDIKKGLMVIGGELHADEEQLLLEKGSAQADLWGINLYPDRFGTTEFVEFDSMINLRPSQNNMSRGVENPAVRQTIEDVVNKLVIKNG